MSSRFARVSVLLSSVAIVAAVAGGASAKEVVPTDDEILQMATHQVGQRWYGVYVMGQKAGWQTDVWTQKNGAICDAVEFKVTLSYLGKETGISVVETLCFSDKPPFSLVSYDSSRDEAGKRTTITGRPRDGKLVYTYDTQGKTREMVVPPDADKLLYALPWAGLARMSPGDHVSSATFDEMTGETHWQKATLKSREKKAVLGVQGDLAVILLEDETGMRLDATVTPAGVVLEGALGPSLRIVMEDKDTAMRLDQGVPDLYSSSVVTATGLISYAKVTRVESMKVRLKAGSAIDMPAHPRQAIAEQDSNSAVVVISACPKKTAEKEADAKYTACNADVPCDAKEHVDLARKLASKQEDPLMKARALSSWVHDSFKYELGAGGGTADQILKEKRGDCTEFSKALLLLLRAIGIPSRTLSGIALASDTPPTFAYHAWVEAWFPDRGWVALDPTWGVFPVDATHIVFDTQDGLHMAAHLGDLSIEILDVDYVDLKRGIRCD
jgi:hypothetical protein